MIPESRSFDLVMGKQWWGSNLLVEPNLWTKMFVFYLVDRTSFNQWHLHPDLAEHEGFKIHKKRLGVGENLRSPNHPQTIPKLPHLALLAQTHSPPSPRLFRHNQTHSGDSKNVHFLAEKIRKVWFAAISFCCLAEISHPEKNCSPFHEKKSQAENMCKFPSHNAQKPSRFSRSSARTRVLGKRYASSTASKPCPLAMS